MSDMDAAEKLQGPPFRDRVDAGSRLGPQLARLLDLPDPVFLALPRGGVPVAAGMLGSGAFPGASLDVLLVRKIGAPGHPELGLGALAEGAEPVLDERLVASLAVSAGDLAARVAAERAELSRRLVSYRSGPLPELAGRDVVLVDDGLATGGTARAAVQGVFARSAARVVVAVPVASPSAVRSLQAMRCDVVALRIPPDLRSVGSWYADFDQLSDAEVLDLLARHRRPAG